MKAIGAAKIIAAIESIDGEKILANAYNALLGINVEPPVALDSKELFETL